MLVEIQTLSEETINSREQRTRNRRIDEHAPEASDYDQYMEQVGV